MGVGAGGIWGRRKKKNRGKTEHAACNRGGSKKEGEERSDGKHKPPLRGRHENEKTVGQRSNPEVETDRKENKIQTRVGGAKEGEKGGKPAPKAETEHDMGEGSR